jgi:hypothetical protein
MIKVINMRKSLTSPYFIIGVVINLLYYKNIKIII